MKSKHIAQDLLCLLLTANYFYHGTVKVLDFSHYGSWLHYSPYVTYVSIYFKYLIPAYEIILSILFLFKRYRVIASTLSIIGQILFITYILYWALFSHQLFWTYQAFWSDSPVPWIQKLIFSIILCWISFMIIILHNIKGTFQTFLRNKPVKLTLTGGQQMLTTADSPDCLTDNKRAKG